MEVSARTSQGLFNSIGVEESRINHLKGLSIKKIEYDIYHKQLGGIILNNVFFNFITSASTEQEIIPMSFEAVRFISSTVMNRMANLIFYHDALSKEPKLVIEENSSELYIRVNEDALNNTLEEFLKFNPLQVLAIDVKYNKLIDEIVFTKLTGDLENKVSPKDIFDSFFSSLKYESLQELSLISFRFAKFYMALIS